MTSTSTTLARVWSFALPSGRAWVNDAAARAADLPGDDATRRQWCGRMAAGQAALIRTFKQQPTRVERVELDGRAWVLKHYSTRGCKRSLLRLLRQSAAWQEWRGAQRLARAGVRICLPVALIDHVRQGRREQTLVLPFVEGPTLNDWLIAAAPPSQWSNTQRLQRLQLAVAIGGQIAQMVRAGIINRDCKPSNLLLDEACLEQAARPMVIDPAGLRRRRGEAQVHRMLAVLDRAAARVGPVTRREQWACLKSLAAADPTLGGRGTLHERARRIARAVWQRRAARPMSYSEGEGE